MDSLRSAQLSRIAAARDEIPPPARDRFSKQLQTSCAPYVSRATWTWIWPSKRRCGELAGACAVQNVRENAETRD